MRRLLLALFLAGCGPSSVWHGDEAFSADERAAIEHGATRMADKTGGEHYHIVWDSGDDGDNQIRRRHAVDGELLGKFSMSSRSSARTIDFAPGLEDMGLLERIAAHEFGHSYGMDDHPEPGWMRSWEPTLEWTDADTRECRDHAKLCAGQ